MINASAMPRPNFRPADLTETRPTQVGALKVGHSSRTRDIVHPLIPAAIFLDSAPGSGHTSRQFRSQRKEARVMPTALRRDQTQIVAPSAKSGSKTMQHISRPSALALILTPLVILSVL